MWDLWGDKVALGQQVFSEYFGFPCQFSFNQLLHTHHHLSSGAGTIGQIMVYVPSGLSLTPNPKKVGWQKLIPWSRILLEQLRIVCLVVEFIILLLFNVKCKDETHYAVILKSLSPCCPDRLWGPPNLLYNGYRRLFPGGKAAGA
jgi:hypothetical protein